MRNQIRFKVYGRYALFTDPITRVGGEKFTYQVPTYQALKGICESIYWKPTFLWIIDSVRVMNPIRTQAQGIRPINYNGGNTLSYYTYLMDVEYEVTAHIEWNLNRPDLEQDRNEHKHFIIAKRMIQKGGRRDVFLGTRECQAYVEPLEQDNNRGYYDNQGDMHFDLMFHSFEYPSETGKEALNALFWKPIMKNGVILFDTDQQLYKRKRVKDMKAEYVATSGLIEPTLQSVLEEV